MPQKAFLKQIIKDFFFLFKCLMCLSRTGSMRETAVFHCESSD